METKNRFFSNADLRKLIVPLIIDQFLQDLWDWQILLW